MAQTKPALEHPWRLLALLVVSIFINFIDRSNLSVAADDLHRELLLGPAQLGQLLSAFFCTYAAFQLVAGWLVDRYNVFWVYGLGFLVWSVATGMTGLVTSFAQLFALRLLLGMGESVAYPSYSRILASGYPEQRRGFCNAAIDAGSKLGPALGTLIGGLIVASVGWRALFFILGGGALLWLVPWFLSIPRHAPARAPEAVGGPGFLDILRRRETWGTFMGLFAINWAWYILVTWLPTYLREARGYSTDSMAVFGSLPYWCIAVSVDHLRLAFRPADRAGLFRLAVRRVVLRRRAAARRRVHAARGPGDERPNGSVSAGYRHGAIRADPLPISGPSPNVWPAPGGRQMDWIAERIRQHRRRFRPVAERNSGRATGLLRPGLRAGVDVMGLGAVSFLMLIPRVEPVDWAAPHRL